MGDWRILRRLQQKPVDHAKYLSMCFLYFIDFTPTHSEFPIENNSCSTPFTMHFPEHPEAPR